MKGVPSYWRYLPSFRKKLLKLGKPKVGIAPPKQLGVPSTPWKKKKTCAIRDSQNMVYVQMTEAKKAVEENSDYCGRRRIAVGSRLISSSCKGNAEDAMRVRRCQNEGRIVWELQKIGFNLISVADDYLVNTTKRLIKE